MRVVGRYSFKNGSDFISNKHKSLLNEIENIINGIDAEQHKTKESEEKTKVGKMIYSPVTLNSAFKKEFKQLGWQAHRIECEYPTKFYVEDYQAKPLNKGAFREIDFVKEKLGVEIQFGKYAFMVYNICAKMTIFSKAGIIDAGIEIVPVKNFSSEMSSGVSYFEQVVWDLERRGVADIDIPVIILGIDHDEKKSALEPITNKKTKLRFIPLKLEQNRTIPLKIKQRTGACPGPKPKKEN